MRLSSQQESENPRYVFNLKKKQLLFNFNGFHTVLEYPKVAKLCIDFLINEQCPCGNFLFMNVI